MMIKPIVCGVAHLVYGVVTSDSMIIFIVLLNVLSNMINVNDYCM